MSSLKDDRVHMVVMLSRLAREAGITLLVLPDGQLYGLPLKALNRPKNRALVASIMNRARDMCEWLLIQAKYEER